MAEPKSAMKKDTDVKSPEKRVNLDGADGPDREEDKSVKVDSKVKIDPAEFAKQMLASIPEEVMDQVKGWMVEQAAITRTAAAAEEARKSPAHKLNRQGTSKIHKFKPPVSIADGVRWLANSGPADSSLIFHNQCMLAFERGVYSEFEDVRDEEDDA